MALVVGACGGSEPTATATPATAGPGEGPTIITVIPVGHGPQSVGVNAASDRVYVANRDDGTVSVIDGASNTVIATFPVGDGASGVGVNPTTGRVYVSNFDDGTVSVIDGASNAVVATVTVGGQAGGVGVNPATDRVYISNLDDGTVSVIDGTSNTIIATIPVGAAPQNVGVNPTTNRIYVASFEDGTVSVIDGASNAVIVTVPVGGGPVGVGVDPSTNRVYVVNHDHDTVSVIDGASNAVIATIPGADGMVQVGVNPGTNRVYVASHEDGTVSVINGATNAVIATVPVGSVLSNIHVGVNHITGLVYVSIAKDDTVYVIADMPAGSTAAPDGGPTPTLAATPVPTPTLTVAQRDVLSVVEAFYEAFNTGDVEALSAILSDDIVISDVPPFGTMDKLAWLAVHVASFIENTQISFTNPRVEGSTLTARHSYRFPDFSLNGALEMVVEEGEITGFTVTSAEETLEEPGELPPSAMPLMDMSSDDNYKGEDGGLYGDGLNGPPPEHRSAALKELAKIEPLDSRGSPSPNGRTVLMSIGMSNTWQEFRQFQRLADGDPGKSSSLVIVNGAIPGIDARAWATMDFPWEALEQILQIYGVTPQQVQVAWVKLANGFPSEPFPTEARRLQGQLATIMNLLKQRYQNLRVVYFSSRIYAGYATDRLNPEPYAYEGAFSVRWLIQDQIDGDPDLNYDPDKGPVTSPLLLWGPYLWADGLNPRSDGLVWEPRDFAAEDGTHPSTNGEDKVARLLLDFFTTDDLAQSWFLESP